MLYLEIIKNKNSIDYISLKKNRYMKYAPKLAHIPNYAKSISCVICLLIHIYILIVYKGIEFLPQVPIF